MRDIIKRPIIYIRKLGNTVSLVDKEENCVVGVKKELINADYLLEESIKRHGFCME